MLSKLLVIRTCKERPLSRDEADLREKFKTSSAGVMRYVSRKFFLQWFGLRDAVAEAILQAEYPCYVSVVRSTGTKASATSKFASPCGQERYCKNCEKVFDMLDKGYGLQMFGDVILALITKALPTWTGTCSTTAEWERTEVACKPHECGPACTGLH